MKVIGIIILFLVQLNVFAQNSGYLGRKNFIDVKSVSYSPVSANIYWLFQDSYGFISEWGFGGFNTGAHVNVGRILNRNKALSIEAGLDFMSHSNYDETFSATIDSKTNCFNIMPKFEFSLGENIMPLGISHQFGVGYYSISGTETYTDANESFEFKYENLKGITFMYAFVLRSSITRNLFINYGTRYTFSKTLNYQVKPFNPFFYAERLDAQKRYNFVSLELGLSYVF